MKKEQKMFNQLRLTMIEYFEKMDKPGNAVVLTTEEGKGFTKAELLTELQRDTQTAREFLYSVVLYTIELFSGQVEIRQEATPVEGNGTVN